MIICRRNKLYADDKTVVLRFLDCRKILQSLNDFFILTVIHKGGSVVFLLRILLCLGILVRIVGSILVYLLWLVCVRRMDMYQVSGFVGFVCSITVFVGQQVSCSASLYYYRNQSEDCSFSFYFPFVEYIMINIFRFSWHYRSSGNIVQCYFPRDYFKGVLEMYLLVEIFN